MNVLPTNIDDEEPVNDDQSDFDYADIGYWGLTGGRMLLIWT